MHPSFFIIIVSMQLLWECNNLVAGTITKFSISPRRHPRFVPSLPQAEIFNYALRFSREKIMRRALSRSLLRRFACVSASALITAPSCRRARRPPAQRRPLLSGTRAREKLSQRRRREKVRTVPCVHKGASLYSYRTNPRHGLDLI